MNSTYVLMISPDNRLRALASSASNSDLSAEVGHLYSASRTPTGEELLLVFTHGCVSEVEWFVQSLVWVRGETLSKRLVYRCTDDDEKKLR